MDLAIDNLKVGRLFLRQLPAASILQFLYDGAGEVLTRQYG